MFSFLNSTNIRTRVLFTVALPILGMLGFAIMIALNGNAKSREMSRVLALAEIAPQVSGLVHELQKERGTSAGYIGSRGEDVTRNDLESQHKSTATALQDFNKTLDAFNVKAYGTDFAGKVASARGNVKQLDTKRTDVLGFSNTVPEMAGYYTGTIKALLNVVHQISGLSTDLDVSMASIAYVNLLEAKERAGQERAMGAAGFGSGTFKKGIYQKFTRLISAQDAYMDVFDKNATREQISFYSSTVRGSDVDRVETMRGLAIDNAFGGSIRDTTGKDWFTTITAKIDLLKTVEDRISNDLVALASDKKGGARTSFLTALGIIAVLLGAIAFCVNGSVNSIVGPLNGIGDTMKALTGGNLQVEISGQDQGGEIGEMSKAIQVFRDGMVRNEEMARQQEIERKDKEVRAKRLADYVNEFESTIRKVVESLAGANATMQDASKEVNAGATDTMSQATGVASAAEQTSVNVQTVAGAAEELATSVSEITKQVSMASDISQNAVIEVDATSSKVAELELSVSKIGDVVDLITDIAAQTNLLALNATIEAARAGDAGKGFAVVASEVKALASQTTQATDEIASQISQVQAATTESVEAIGKISTVINEVSDVNVQISAAVEEQSAATSEIARNGEEASAGTASVSQSIIQVQKSAESSQKAATEITQVSDDLTRQSTALKDSVDEFLRNVQQNETDAA